LLFSPLLTYNTLMITLCGAANVRRCFLHKKWNTADA